MNKRGVDKIYVELLLTAAIGAFHYWVLRVKPLRAIFLHHKTTDLSSLNRILDKF